MFSHPFWKFDRQNTSCIRNWVNFRTLLNFGLEAFPLKFEPLHCMCEHWFFNTFICRKWVCLDVSLNKSNLYYLINEFLCMIMKENGSHFQNENIEKGQSRWIRGAEKVLSLPIYRSSWKPKVDSRLRAFSAVGNFNGSACQPSFIKRKKITKELFFTLLKELSARKALIGKM